MRSFVLIVLLACTNAAVLKSDKAGDTPKLLGLTAINPMGIVVEWSPVKKLGDELVVGYKVCMFVCIILDWSLFLVINLCNRSKLCTINNRYLDTNV